MDKSSTRIQAQGNPKSQNNPNAVPDQKKTPITSKKNIEMFWQLLLIFVSIVAAVLSKKLYLYQTLPQFEGIRKGNIYQLLFFGLMFAVVYGLIDFYSHKYGDPFFFKHYINEEKFPDPQDRLKRCYTLVKWAYQNTYYIIVSIWGYNIIRQTSFCPTWLGGHGSCFNLTNYVYSFDEATIQMKAFYMIQFGKQFNRFITHVFIRPQGGYYEFGLHHGLATFLILFSYLSNMWLIGIFILIIHDISDAFLGMGRAYRIYKHLNKVVLNIIYFLAIVIWVSCRIFIFSSCCVYSSIKTCYIGVKDNFLTEEFSEVLLLPYFFMAFMLSALQIQHFFWTYYIGKSFVSVSITDKVKHTYD